MHNNNRHAAGDLLNFAQAFSNERTSFIWSSINTGYPMGGIMAMSESLPHLQRMGCECALHLHPDVYIVDEHRFLKQMDRFCSGNYTGIWQLNRFMGSSNTLPSFDAFFFKPTRLPADAFDFWAHFQSPGLVPEYALMMVAWRYNGLGAPYFEHILPHRPRAVLNITGHMRENYQASQAMRQQYGLRFHGQRQHGTQEFAEALIAHAEFNVSLLARAADLWGLVHVHNARLASCPEPIQWKGFTNVSYPQTARQPGSTKPHGHEST